MSQHANLLPERWATFSLSRQILMIANEMHRAGKLGSPEDRERRRNSYERVLNLCDITVRVQSKYTLRRELLRWREVAGELYLAPRHDPDAHRQALRALLLLTPESAGQVPHVCG